MPVSLNASKKLCPLTLWKIVEDRRDGQLEELRRALVIVQELPVAAADQLGLHTGLAERAVPEVELPVAAGVEQYLCHLAVGIRLHVHGYGLGVRVLERVSIGDHEPLARPGAAEGQVGPPVANERGKLLGAGDARHQETAKHPFERRFRRVRQKLQDHHPHLR